MKPPKHPEHLYPPHKPVKPEEYLPAKHKSFVFEQYSATLASLLEATKGIDPSKVSFSVEGSHTYYDGIDIEASIHWEDPDALPVKNPYYKRALADYELRLKQYSKALEKYKEARSTYDQRLAEYKVKSKEYFIWFHSNQLKKLKNG